MLPACRTASEGFALPTFDLTPPDVEEFLEELWEFQSAFHDCFTRSEARTHFFDSMVGQLSPLERKSIEPMALHKIRLGKKAPALTVAQRRRLLEVILPLRTSTIEEVLALVAWVQRRNHGAYLAHRKRREAES